MMVPILRIYTSTLVCVAVLASLLAGVLTAPVPAQAQDPSPTFQHWAWFTLLPVKGEVHESSSFYPDNSVTLEVTPAYDNILSTFCGPGGWVGMGTPMGDGQSTAGGTDFGGPFPQCVPYTYEQNDGPGQFVLTNGASNYGNTVYGFKAGVGYQEEQTIANPSSVGLWWNYVATHMVGGNNLIQALGPVVSPSNLTCSAKTTALPKNINGIFLVDLAVTKSGGSKYYCGTLAVMMQQITEEHDVQADWGGLAESTGVSLAKDLGVTMATGNPLGIFIGLTMFFTHVLVDLLDIGETKTESSDFWVQPYTTDLTSFGVPYYVAGKVETPQVTTEPLYTPGTVLIPCGDGTKVWLGITHGGGAAGGTFDVVYLDKQEIEALNIALEGSCGANTTFSYCHTCTGCKQVLHQYLWADHYTVTCDSCGGQGKQTKVHCRDPSNIQNIDGVLTCEN
jgi:hypothetical protein